MTAAAWRSRYTAHAVRNTRTGPAALADYIASFKAHRHGCWPSQRHLAQRFKVCVRTIQRWLQQLNAAAIITIEGHPPKQDHITGKWYRRTNRYRAKFKNERGPKVEKPQVKPRRHLCHVEGLSEEPCNGSAPESAAIPPWVLEDMSAAEWTKRKMGQL